MVERQEEPLVITRIVLRSLEQLIRFTIVKLTSAQQRGDDERVIYKLQRQQAELEDRRSSNQSLVDVWESGGRKKWEKLKHHLTKLMDELRSQEINLEPEAMKDYLQLHRESLDKQRSMVMTLRQAINDPDDLIRELQKQQIARLPDGYDEHWGRFMQESNHFEFEMYKHESVKRATRRAIETYEESERIHTKCVEKYEKTSAKAQRSSEGRPGNLQSSRRTSPAPPGRLRAPHDSASAPVRIPQPSQESSHGDVQIEQWNIRMPRAGSGGSAADQDNLEAMVEQGLSALFPKSR